MSGSFEAGIKPWHLFHADPKEQGIQVGVFQDEPPADSVEQVRISHPEINKTYVAAQPLCRGRDRYILGPERILVHGCENIAGKLRQKL